MAQADLTVETAAFVGRIRLFPGANPWSRDAIATIDLSWPERSDPAHVERRLAQLDAGALGETPLPEPARGDHPGARFRYQIAGLALQLQRLAAHDITRFDLLPGARPLMAPPAYPYLDAPLALAAGDAALRIAAEALRPGADAASARQASRRLVDWFLKEPACRSLNDLGLDLMTRAASRGIPFVRTL